MLALLLTTLVAHADPAQCQIQLTQALSNDPHISSFDPRDYYSCGPKACAIAYDVRSGGDVSKRIGFLDPASSIQVLSGFTDAERISGRGDTGRRNRVAYINGGPLADSFQLTASIETPRDAMFWPPHRVFVKKQFTCTKD